MFRLDDGKDISDSDYKKYIVPHEDACIEYLQNDLIPNYVSFYIGKGYLMSALWENTFDIHIYTATTMFNVSSSCLNFKKIKDDVVDILFKKYNLKVVNEEPLELEEVR